MGLQYAGAGLQGEFAMLVFGVTRNFEDAKSRLDNLSEIVRQAGRCCHKLKAGLAALAEASYWL